VTGVQTCALPICVELHSAHPCKFVTIKAENSLYTKTRNYSNYTTNENVYEGWSPIKSFPSLKYGPTVKMEEIESYHTDRMFPFYHCLRVPYEEGYNIIPFSSRVAEFNFDVGVILSNLKVKLPIELGNTNPMITSVKIYKDGEPHDDVILGEEETLNESHFPGMIDEIIEEKEEEVKTESEKIAKFKIIVRTVISKTLVYSKIKDKKYFRVHFKAHEEVSK